MGGAIRPSCTIIGGPNGSGKSLIFELLRPAGRFVNADEVARRLNPAHPQDASVAAGRVVLETLAGLRSERSSFVYETTLSSRQSLSLMSACRHDGFEINLIFVGLRTVELNLSRIRERVRRGGHDIPADVVRRRHVASVRNLAAALAIADNGLVFDNSDLSPRLLVSIEAGALTEAHLDPAMPFHRKIGQATEKALSLEPHSLTGQPRAGA